MKLISKNQPGTAAPAKAKATKAAKAAKPAKAGKAAKADVTANAAAPSAVAAAAAAPIGSVEGGPAHRCANCNAPMADAQDWCVQCGANDKRTMRTRAGWASAGGLMAASAILATGAAAAGVAALTQGSAKEANHPLRALAPVTQPAPAAPPSTPANPGTPETLTIPPKHGATAQTQTHTTHTTTTAASTAQGTSTQSTSSSSTTSATQTTTTGAAAAIELQAQDLSVYNPRKAYPAADVGNPRQSFEEGATSLWSVQVQPPGASKLDVGLLVHLPRFKRVGSVEVITATPGYTLEILGTKSEKAPASITDSGWTKLAKQNDLRRKSTITLSNSRERFRYIVLWITSIPSSLAGSAGSPGHVSLDELALLPPGG
ncbi:MAG: hypothetical protein ACYDA6_09245 [Solirubrobacteraceae bacterium]